MLRTFAGGTNGEEDISCLLLQLTEAITAACSRRVTLLGRRIEDRVAAATEGTIGTAVSTGGETILWTIITFFSLVDLPIATEEGEEAAVHTLVRQCRVVERLLALLIQKHLDNAIPADADLRETVTGAPVGVPEVPIVAFFWGALDDEISAGTGGAQ